MTVASIPVSIRFSDRAITRYRERCKPALDDENAGRDLGRIAELGRVLTEAPRWLAVSCGGISEPARSGRFRRRARPVTDAEAEAIGGRSVPRRGRRPRAAAS